MSGSRPRGEQPRLPRLGDAGCRPAPCPVPGVPGADLVFTTRYGTALSAENVRRDFRNALLLVPSIADPSVWTTKELRQSFVSVMSSEGVLIEEISRLVGHNNSRVTELVYRKELRPVIQTGARAMNSVIGTVEVSLGDMEPLFSVAEARGGRGA